MRFFPLKKCATNVIMLTEEQIQKLAKKFADEHGDDEEECKKYVRFMANSSEKLHAFLPEGKKELFKKTLEGEFFEDLIQRVFITAQQISKIYWMCRGRMNYC